VAEKENLTDEMLAHLASGGDRKAEDILIRRFSGFVYELARPYFLPGADQQDILQEGMIGLWEAVHAFDGEKSRSFIAFAAVCIKRQIISAVKNYNRQKYIPLNNYLSLYAPMGEEENFTLLAALEDVQPDLEEALIGREELSRLKQRVDAALAEQEKKVLVCYMRGESYQEIADSMGKSVKAVDNTMQRVRRKLQLLLREEE